MTIGDNVPMDISIAKLLGEGTLPEELLKSLQEAFDKKLAIVREEVEETVREEFAQRFETDKANLVEAMDRMLTDVATKHESEKNAAIQKFSEAREEFRKAKKEMKQKVVEQIDSSVKASKDVAVKQITNEVTKLREERKRLVEERTNMVSILETTKTKLKEAHTRHIEKMDEFVIRQVRKELGELNEDHNRLIETRATLVAESRTKLRETQARFVKEAANTVERVINETLRSEMAQLHEELERNRQNMFGRRIFEAVAAEYMTSYLSEGTEIKSLQEVLESRNTELKLLKTKLDETVKENLQATRKVQLAEDRVVRNKVMNELLTNLRGEKRSIMEGMLETVKTNALKQTFNKLLPVVLNENSANKPASKPILVEKTSNEVSGNQRNNKLNESVIEEDNNNINNDLAKVVRLAGIKK